MARRVRREPSEKQKNLPLVDEAPLTRAASV